MAFQGFSPPQGIEASSLAANGTYTVDTIRVAAGTATAPTISFTGETNTGIFRSASASRLCIGVTGTARAVFFSNSVRLGSNVTLVWDDGTDANAGTSDLFLARDAADTFAQKNSTNAQTWNHYGTEITAGTRYSRLAIKHAVTSVTAAVGATVTATSLIPAKANVLGVNTVVTTGLGVSTGTTGYTVGDGTDADRWGAIVGTVAGTDTDQTDATADPTGWFTAANNVVITATGGNFDGTGVILIDVAYTMTEAA